MTNQTTIQSGGRLRGDGTFNGVGGIHNAGEIDLGSNSLQITGGALVNGGLVTGNGHIDNTLDNKVSGEVQVAAGQRLYFTGDLPHINAGQMEAIGIVAPGGLAELRFEAAVTNAPGTGLILARGAANLRFNGGLDNQGSLGLAFAEANVFGDVNNSGVVNISGNSNVLFADDVVNKGTLNVSGGSTAVFFGSYSGDGASGTGSVSMVGDLRPGFSPAAIRFGGDLQLGADATTHIELGGPDAGAEHDQINVTGQISLGGTLAVELLGDFTPSRGDSFEVLTYGSRVGEFKKFTGLDLGDGLMFSPTFSDNSLTLTVLRSLLSDLTRDGFVDADDLFVLLANWDTLGGAEVGDLFDDPAKPGINADDLFVLLSEWTGPDPNPPAEAAVGAAAVPEPSSLLLAVMATLGLSFFRRRRRRA